MEELHTQIIAKLDKLDERLDSVDKVLVRNTTSLEDHIRRTEILENEMEPVKAHVAQVSGAMKLIIAISSVAGIVQAVYLLLR
jgi:hypothetical protein